MELGAQLYTVRMHCQTPEAFADTLGRIADIGYRTVQVSGTCAYEPEWLREQLTKTGLRCVLTHIPLERLRDETAAVIAAHEVFDCTYIGLGCGPDCLGGDGMAQVLELAHGAGRAIHAAGRQFMYHNHNAEFTRDQAGGLTRLDYLLANTTPQELGVTLDTYWVQAGGKDVLRTIQALAGRIPCVHLKDYAMHGFEPRMAPVGEGNLPWDAILPALEQAQTRHVLVEQDDCYGEDPFACLRRSYEFLKAQGLQ